MIRYCQNMESAREAVAEVGENNPVLLACQKVIIITIGVVTNIIVTTIGFVINIIVIMITIIVISDGSSQSSLFNHHHHHHSCPQDLGHQLPLSSYLLKPVQRLTK